MQKDKIRISNPEAAHVLRTSSILGHFLERPKPEGAALGSRSQRTQVMLQKNLVWLQISCIIMPKKPWL
jgi:hypothetical protein